MKKIIHMFVLLHEYRSIDTYAILLLVVRKQQNSVSLGSRVNRSPG